MRKLKLLVQLSVDGYLADSNGKTDWMIWNWGPVWTWDIELQKYFTDLTASIDCILLSRKMAEEGFIGHWEKVTENPDDLQFTFAKKIANTNKVVFTKTLDNSNPIIGGLKNVSLAKGDLTDEVDHLKKQEGKDMIVYGGATLVSSLLHDDLIDELFLFINPTALGTGMKIFHEPINLKLIKARSFGCGVTILSYHSEKYSKSM